MIFQSNTILNGKQSVPYKATVYGLLMNTAEQNFYFHSAACFSRGALRAGPQHKAVNFIVIKGAEKRFGRDAMLRALLLLKL